MVSSGPGLLLRRVAIGESSAEQVWLTWMVSSGAGLLLSRFG